ncbi:hypothetical protein CQ054_19945 [Ochrobactrum sp. MYb29]|nr:hypothetical protein CQ054_19945 [Ochrobactrum sp. MYb29]
MKPTFRFAKGVRIFASLKYQGVDRLISRLRIFDLDTEFHYMLYGVFRKLMPSFLPVAYRSRAKSLMVRAVRLVSSKSVVGASMEPSPLTLATTKYALQVVDPGGTTLARNEMYIVWSLGICPCSAHEVEIATFAEEEAVRQAIEIAAEGECLTDDRQS